MKNLFLLLLMSLLFSFCATTKKTSKNALIDALIGQNELVIIKSLGTPSNVIHTNGEEKVIVYEHASEGPDLGHNNSNSTQSADQNKYNSNGGLTFTSNVNKAANDPNFSIYQTKISYLKIYINKQGNCFRIENTVPQKQSEAYLKSINEYKAKN
jgi:hypothetical protein